MKKFTILLSALMLLTLTACAPSVPKDPPLIQETTTQAPSETTAAEDTTTDTTADTEAPESGDPAETTPDTAPAGSADGAAIAALAEKQLGVPFATGGATPEAGFDNPGLISYVLNSLGMTAERTVSALSKMGSSVDFSQLQSGDILFFASEEAGEAPSFGGVYVGDGKMVYAPVPDDVVKTADITSQYWSKRFVTAQRVGTAE